MIPELPNRLKRRMSLSSVTIKSEQATVAHSRMRSSSGFLDNAGVTAGDTWLLRDSSFTQTRRVSLRWIRDIDAMFLARACLMIKAPGRRM